MLYLKYMFYNTKIRSLFETDRAIRLKNVVYILFLDAYQKQTEKCKLIVACQADVRNKNARIVNKPCGRSLLSK